MLKFHLEEPPPPDCQNLVDPGGVTTKGTHVSCLQQQSLAIRAKEGAGLRAGQERKNNRQGTLQAARQLIRQQREWTGKCKAYEAGSLVRHVPWVLHGHRLLISRGDQERCFDPSVEPAAVARSIQVALEDSRPRPRLQLQLLVERALDGSAVGDDLPQVLGSRVGASTQL